MNKIAERILEKIRCNEITAKPKTYFRLKLLALVFVALSVFIVSIFLFSFIFFSLRASGEALLFGFGTSGIAVFLLLFPWKLFFVDIFLILILGYLCRSFRFGYQRPVIRSIAAISVVMILLGLILDLVTPFHHMLLREADRNALPFIGDMYEQVRRPPPPPLGHDIYRGVISGMDANTLAVSIEIDEDNPSNASTTLVTVYVPQSDATTSFMVGDRIFISGSLIQGEIHALDVQSSPEPESVVE